LRASKKAKIHVYWLVYLIAYMAYASILSSLELHPFRNPASLFYFYGITVLILIGLKIYNDSVLSKKLAIFYEEEPAPVKVTL
jgi:hypothetical protein